MTKNQTKSTKEQVKSMKKQAKSTKEQAKLKKEQAKSEKESAKSKGEKSKRSFFESAKHFTTSERVHFVVGLLICFFVIYIGIALISFFFTGEADQSVVNNMGIKEMFSKKALVENWGGVRGAYLANVIINHWFGVPSFFMLFFLGSMGVGLMRLCRMHFFKRFLVCSILTVWGSIFLAFAFSWAGDRIFFHSGGRHGSMLSEWLTNNIGSIGAILTLIAGFILIAVFMSRKTVPLLQSKLTFGRWRSVRKPSANNKTNAADGGRTDTDDEWITTGAGAYYGDDDDGYETDHDERDVIGKSDRSADESRRLRRGNGVTIDGTNGVGDFTVEVARGEDDPYDKSELGVYDPRLDLSRYRFPTLSLLKKYEQSDDKQVDMDEQNENQRRIKKTLEDFGIQIISIKATVGPTITLYEVVPDKGIRIAKIRNLEDDIAMNLAALGIRIIAPMPGKGTIGLEVPNKKPRIVSIESVIASRKFVESKYALPIVLGRTITNEVYMFDLTKMPHLLVAGATGQGKSVGLNTMIASLLYKKHPAELKFVLVDPKMVEFNIYADIERHYLAKLPDADEAIITDFEKVVHTLKSLCKEMDDRYNLLTRAHVRNISEYNEKFINRNLLPTEGHKYLPYIVVIIDEFGDLIMTAGKEIEMPIARIAQKARAVGIHMIIATQRPTTNIITGTIKANFPARVGFKVSSMIDSRTILDAAGANKLVGNGDLLFSQGNDMTRIQCAYVSTDEIEGLVKFIGDQVGYEKAYELPEVIDENQDGVGRTVDLSNRDPLFDDAARLIVLQQQGSTSLIQRKFSIGYNRAGRLMDQLEVAGIVGPIEGNKGRQVLMTDEYALEQKLNQL
jgi:S-DNA-T family DNA segregation ATPase FtsK/SpoIIIE